MLKIDHRDGAGRSGRLGCGLSIPNVLVPRMNGEGELASPAEMEPLIHQGDEKKPLIQTMLQDGVSLCLEKGTDISAMDDVLEGRSGYDTGGSSDRDMNDRQWHVNWGLAGETDVRSIPFAGVLVQRPAELLARIISVRGGDGHNHPVHLPGVHQAELYAVYTYAGADIFDGSPLVAQASCGRRIPHPGEPEMEPTDFQPALKHNLEVARREIETVRRALARGVLRELAETRASSSLEAMTVLRHLDCRFAPQMESISPIARGVPMKVPSREALSRPEVSRWIDRIRKRYTPPPSAKVLVLLPCSARKPYSTSKTHRILSNALDTTGKRRLLHEVIVTSPLGTVPRELENFYPAASYDVPVTGRYLAEEREMIRSCLSRMVDSGNYSSVIVDLREEWEFVEDILPDAVNVCRGHPTSRESQSGLRSAVIDACQEMKVPSKDQRHRDDMGSLATFQFGQGGAVLAEGCTVKGNPFQRRLFVDGDQVASLNRDRGMLALTLRGGELLSSRQTHRVEIEDFIPKGTIFCQGIVNADGSIRSGDEVVAVHQGTVRGVGVALVGADELRGLDSGPGIKTRHHARED